MKKILHIFLALALCLGLGTVSLAAGEIQPRYTDISYITGVARAESSTQIYCSANISAYENQDIVIELIVTDEYGDEVFASTVSGYKKNLSLSKYVKVAAGGTYTCEFYFSCGVDSPVITRTVRT